MTGIWTVFAVFVLPMRALDLGDFHRRAHVVVVNEAAAWSAGWLALALAVAGFVCVAWEGRWGGLSGAPDPVDERPMGGVAMPAAALRAPVSPPGNPFLPRRVSGISKAPEPMGTAPKPGRRRAMAYAVVHFFPGGTKDQYEASIAAVHPGKGVLPKGQAFHAAGPSAGGWTIVAIHESKESWEQFRDGILLPRFQQGIAGGFTSPPQEAVFEVHNLHR